MLIAEQVAGFFLHEDPLLRDHAIRALEDAHDQGPADAELLWQVIDRFPAPHHHSTHYFRLRRFSHTEASVRRTIDALAATRDENQIMHFSRALAALPLELLARHREAVLATPHLDEERREHIRLRLDEPDKPPEELWQELLALCSKDQDAGWWGSFDHATADRLVERLVRHREFAAARAMEILADADIIDYREIFAAVILGKLRWEPAIDELVKRLVCDGDVICEEASKALVGIGTPAVVARISEEYEREDIEYRGYVDGALGRINIPESEALLLKLMDDPRYEEETSSLAMALCDLCSREALPNLLAMVEGATFDTRLDEPEHLMVAVATMTGYELPDAERWRRRAEERERRARESAARMATDGTLEAFAKLLAQRRPQDGLIEREEVARPVTTADFEPADDDEPFVRTEPKVGRNDPCPCESGKKYKKCCGKF